MNELEFAKIRKNELDNHIKSAGNSSSILGINTDILKDFNNLNFNKIKEECLRLGFNIDFIGNTIHKKHSSPENYTKDIIFSYDNIHK